MSSALLEIIFKNLGLNPEELKKQMENGVKELKTTINHFDERLNKLERKIDFLVSCTETKGPASYMKPDALIKHLVNGHGDGTEHATETRPV